MEQRRAQSSSRASSNDLDHAAAIDCLVEAFYERVLADPELAPVFLDVAGIDVSAHLPRIKAFWRKMLLGEPGYDRHMVAHHAAIHACQPLTAQHFERWLALFHATVDTHFSGPYAERAHRLAATIAANLARNLDTCLDAGLQRRLGG